jgi:4'-phosphopantetheinyl transferase
MPGRAARREENSREQSDVISALTWPASGILTAISADEVHLWAWPLETVADELSAHIEILGPAELERMHRFHFAPDRERYAIAHANQRRILGGYLQQPANKIRFRANRFGKPELAAEAAPLHFSLSHSQNIAVLAVSSRLPVGVDVEEVRPIEPEVAATHFSASELSRLSQLTGDAWLSGFFRCWTRKEAILKAEGVGLHRALDSFDVELLPDAPAQLLGTRVPFLYPWRLYDVTPAPGTFGALATGQGEARLACFRFDH